MTYRYGGDAEMIADIRLPDRVLTVADQTTLAFGKVKVWLPKGNREKDVELVLTDEELLIRPDSRSVSASRIEWKQIEALSFERKRIGPGRRIAILKHNWLVVKWTHSSGPERLHLHLDGDDIGALLAAISERSGVPVDGWARQPKEGG